MSGNAGAAGRAASSCGRAVLRRIILDPYRQSVMAELIVLRLIHVLGGIFWVGAGLFNLLFLAPAMAAAGPAAGPIMQVMKRRRIFVIMPTVALLTILSGLRLMMIVSGNFGGAYFRSDAGAAFAFGGACAIVAFVIGVAFAMPAQRRLGAIGPELAAAADDATRARLQAEASRLQGRMRRAGPATAILLVLAAVAMAVARYL